MNHYYRVVFNRSLGVMQAVSELACGHTKGRKTNCRSDNDSKASIVSSLNAARKPSVLSGLVLLSLASVFLSLSAHADTTIDTHEVVNGHGFGTWPSPFDPGLVLTVGDEAEASLTIINAGVVDSAAGIQETIVGLQAGSRGTITVSGPGSTLRTGELKLGRAITADGTLVIDNGGLVSVTHPAGTSLTFSPTSTATLSLNGTAGARGVLETALIHKGGGDASITFDGGMLRAQAHEHNFLGNFTPGDIQIERGGAYIDTNGFDIGIEAPLQGAGALTKQGGGTLTLSGVNTHAGGTRLLGGVVSVSSDASLGAANAGLEFNGGTLKITDSAFDTTNRTVNLGTNGGRFDMEFNSLNGEVVTLAGAITGSGTLTKLGRGDLRLTGDNTYGNTVIEYGELIGDSRSISGNVYVYDDGTLTFDQSGNGQFAGNISGTPSPQVSAAKEGTGTLVLNGRSSVNWLIAEGELITSADRFQGYALTGPDGTITFNESGDATLISAVQGVGQFNKTGDGTLRLPGDSSAFTGRTTVSEGTLSVGGHNGAGRLGGTLTVAQGGTLSGTGQVGTTTIESGGRIAPGNSVGTLDVAGDITFQPGSLYEFDINPQSSESDHINVAGSATLNGGSLVYIGANSPSTPQTSYRILSAGTGLTGAFEHVASDLAFLTPSLAYDYDNHTVDLTLQRNDIAFESLANTPNQLATAGALASLPGNSALIQRILNLPEGAPAAVFDSLSGEMHASVVSGLQAASDTVRTVPLSHLRRNLSAGMMPGAPTAQSGSHPLPASSLPQSAALPLWAEVVGNWHTMKGDGNAARLRQSMGGLFVGGDHGVGAGWRIGGALGYTDAKTRVDDRNSKTDIRTYSATLYGGKAVDIGTGRLNLLVGGAYGRHSIKSRRHTSVLDWNDTLRANYHAHTTQIFGELGYAISAGRATIEPFAGLAWTDVRTRGFSESGGPTALSASSQSHAMTTSTLGLRASTGFELGRAQGLVYGSVAWRHAFGGITPQRTLAFDAGQPFTVAGVPIARDAALLELGTDVFVSSTASIGASYGAQLGGGNREHTGKINVRWRF